jgi:glutaminyl-peptide cyclotransferase
MGIASASGVLPQRRSAPQTIPTYGYQLVRSYPHDPQAFTQGLSYNDGHLYEGTGLNGRSSIRKVKLESGEVVQIQHLESQYFGEGIAIWQDTVVQLTWQSQIGFVYDRKTFQRKRTFTYRGEGWGLTHDGKRLIMSDGQADGMLRYIDPATMKEAGRLPVRDGDRPWPRSAARVRRGDLRERVADGSRGPDLCDRPRHGWIDLRAPQPHERR